MKETEQKMHKKFMRIALEQAADALGQDEFPVGAVFVHEEKILATGKRENSQEQRAIVNEIDHAEIVALRNFLAQESDIPMEEITVYSTMEPCLMCYSTMILNGIRRIVYAYEDVMGGGTNLPLAQLNPLYKVMEVDVAGHVLREESLDLFKQFFANPGNNYWKDSLLASYTLSQ
jgi:tRNA(adenine34) deaminase